ncbi:arginyl-tRNA synthetase, putative [Perkinsus marinus ATCC 50983]|uniref:arginine--tRNA ligase n=1 Tax=Perkinsus marinus (strain ATCC 50983 / TXsc) TaxID=423536 RepID=C5KRF3_PERM5|nr:arginyl-tRNA synthetase, putative [Perkinsus marinus ATCC 50983]EER12926.1 arginyl-tRNA synthetase, putative [Perkinsus marinus ATCC 50983]|eukprot:XP_002781131.1 arginyl-tRNA synthetase, putative [Perkinsus marinus ATCC 50983]
MKPVSSQVHEAFGKALRSTIPSNLQASCPDPMVATANPKFGDYQCNNAMGLAKKFKSELPDGMKIPKQIGEKIKSNLMEESPEEFESVTVAPAGFVTVKLSSGWIAKQLTSKCKDGKVTLDLPNKEAPRKVIVDMSSPNIAKEMHVGHLRSTILGETVSRILEYSGNDVHRINHVGDWGTQFGMLIEHMKDAYPDFLHHTPEVSDLQTFYKAAKKRFDEEPDFKKRSQEEVVALQSGDEYARKAWQICCDISRKSFEEVYNRLGIEGLKEQGESFYNEMIGPTVETLEKEGLVVESNGAKCIFTDVDDVPMMVVKSDGGYGYDSTDVTAVWYRLTQLHADEVVYITDLGQEVHFKKLFEVAKMAGWHHPPQTKLEYLGFGVVCGDDGKKFKTRSGATVKLTDLLDEAEDRAKKELESRLNAGEGEAAGRSTGLTEEEFDRASKIIGDDDVIIIPHLRHIVIIRFTAFYTECKVVGSDQERSRLLLCEATRRVLAQCFDILDITPLERI